MRILIVEDDRKIGAFLRKGLRREQYAVDLCRDGEEAIYLVQLNSYDVVILDIMLPGKDGFTVCRELREKSVLTPILMLTAKDSLQDKIVGLSEGADDYLTKPFSFEELLARIRALLRRNQDYKAGVLKEGDLEMDPLRRIVSRGGRIIDLSGKEYALLEYLLRNKGRVMSQSMIIEHVWDMDYEGASNTVNVHICHLREKIDKEAKVKLIKTVRGQGYKVSEN